MSLKKGSFVDTSELHLKKESSLQKKASFADTNFELVKLNSNKEFNSGASFNKERTRRMSQRFVIGLVK